LNRTQTGPDFGRTLGGRHGAGGGAGDVGVSGGGRRGVGGRGVVRGRRGRRGDLLRRKRRVGRVPRGGRGRRGVASSGGGGGRGGRRMHVAGGEVWACASEEEGTGWRPLHDSWTWVPRGLLALAFSLPFFFFDFDSRILMRRSGLHDLRETFDLREYSTVMSRTWQFSNFDLSLSSSSKFLSREGPCIAS
jgi:hypothetical protein